MKKFLNLLIITITAIFLFLSSEINVYADELSFAVAPSKIVNLVIEPGNKETLTFKVGNRSVFPAHQVEKNELYNFEIKVEGKMYENDGTEVINKDIIKISNDTLRCKPNKSASVDVTIDIPSDFERNSYEASIVFTRMPIAGTEDTSNTNTITSIRVPIYLGVGDPSEYANLKTNFEVDKFKIDLGEEKTISQYVKNNLKQLITLNPFKIIDTFKSISQKDIYVIKKGDSIVIDTISDIFTDLESVITNDKKKLSDTKYILASKDDYEKSVKNIYFDNKLVKFHLDGDTLIEIKCENKVRDNIKAQINTLIKENDLKSPKFKFFVDNLRVPKNNKYDITEYNVDITLKNTGEKETFVTSAMVLKKDSTTEIGNATLELITLQKNKAVNTSIPLSLTGEFSTGTYNLYGSFVDIKNVVRNANFKFDVNLNLDKQIFAWTLIVYIACIILVIAIIVLIIITLRNKKGKVGYVAEESIEYTTIPKTDVNFTLFKELLNLEDINDLDKFVIVSSIDVIVRNKPEYNGKTIKTLHKNAIVEVVEKDIESDSIIWIKVKFNKKMINRNQE